MKQQVTVIHATENSTYEQKISILRRAKALGVDLAKFGLNKPFGQWNLNRGKASEIIQLLVKKQEAVRPEPVLANVATKQAAKAKKQGRSIDLATLVSVLNQAGIRVTQ